MQKYKNLIHEVADYPVKGVSFKDISPLLASPLLKEAVDDLGQLVSEPPDFWVGIDARGFIFAGALAAQTSSGLIMCRKKGKLPEPVVTLDYQTEYSNDSLCIKRGRGKVVIVDDVIATGGSMSAVDTLCQKAGYQVIGQIALINLLYLPKHAAFNLNVKSVLQYE